MTMQRYIRIAAGLLLVLLFYLQFFCSSGIDPQENPVLKGTVLDQQGKPVSGALIEVEYALDYGDINLPKIQTPQMNTIIRFAIPEPGPVKVWITSYGGTDTVRVLMDELAMAGYYMLIWDGKNQAGRRVINHIYQSHVLYQGADTTHNIYVNYDYSGAMDPDSIEYYTLSDASGNFTIPAEDLACILNVEVDITDELGNKLGTVKLSREIKVWALHHAHGTVASDNLVFRADGPTKVQLRY